MVGGSGPPLAVEIHVGSCAAEEALQSDWQQVNVLSAKNNSSNQEGASSSNEEGSSADLNSYLLFLHPSVISAMKVLLLILPGISFGLSIPSAQLLRVLETCVPTLPTLTITYTTPAKFMVTRIIMDHIAAALHHLWMSTCHLCLKMELSHQFVLMGVDMPKGHGCDCNRQAKEDWIRAVALLRL